MDLKDLFCKKIDTANHLRTNFTSFAFPTHCKLPFTNMPNRSHKASASSMECAENIKPIFVNIYEERLCYCETNKLSILYHVQQAE